MENMTSILKIRKIKGVAMFTDNGIDGCGLFSLTEDARNLYLEIL
ncbi:hypothetical protein [Clostridium estertheticum]|nr:hypothetical protein [Clostridium estertheticum]